MQSFALEDVNASKADMYLKNCVSNLWISSLGLQIQDTHACMHTCTCTIHTCKADWTLEGSAHALKAVLNQVALKLCW